ncbi:MAG: hypothetical protein ACFCU8_14430 [Thermosynechococcaceae cyanobacterium]
MSTQIVTAQQLYEQGLDAHQVQTLTQNLATISATTSATSIGQQQGYPLRDIIAKVRDSLAAGHWEVAQSERMHAILSVLLQQLDNVIEAPFGLSRDQQINFYMQKILRTQASFSQSTARPSEPANVVLLRAPYSEAIE